MRHISFLLFLLIFIFGQAALPGTEGTIIIERLGALEVGKPLPRNILAYDVNGNLFDFSEHIKSRKEGHFLFVFFATWCTPCLEEIDLLKKHVKNLEQHNVMVILVNVPVNQDGTPEKKPGSKTKKYLEEQGIPFFTVLDRNSNLSKTLFGIFESSLPKSYLIGRDKHVKGIFDRIGSDYIEKIIGMRSEGNPSPFNSNQGTEP